VIGLFDSGLGGLTVARRVRERLPDVDMLFLADQKHVPYGDRAPSDLRALLETNLAWLDNRGVTAIVMACNTSCAIGAKYGWPQTSAPVFDLLDSAVVALEKAGATRIGVVATVATVASGAYGARIRGAIPGADVWEVAAPDLVPIVEEGLAFTPQAAESVARGCDALPSQLDAVVYGCTHYPVLAEHFARALGPKVLLIDPAIVQAERLSAFLRQHPENSANGVTEYVTSGDAQRFRERVIALMNEPDPVVREMVPVY
jgi:glutamate racemase